LKCSTVARRMQNVEDLVQEPAVRISSESAAEFVDEALVKLLVPLFSGCRFWKRRGVRGIVWARWVRCATGYVLSGVRQPA
jgi:hypothetical protein